MARSVVPIRSTATSSSTLSLPFLNRTSKFEQVANRVMNCAFAFLLMLCATELLTMGVKVRL